MHYRVSTYADVGPNVGLLVVFNNVVVRVALPPLPPPRIEFSIGGIAAGTPPPPTVVVCDWGDMVMGSAQG
jgi:hypothetical protein